MWAEVYIGNAYAVLPSVVVHVTLGVVVGWGCCKWRRMRKK